MAQLSQRYLDNRSNEIKKNEIDRYNACKTWCDRGTQICPETKIKKY